MGKFTRMNKRVHFCKLTSFDFQSVGLRGYLIFSFKDVAVVVIIIVLKRL